MPLFGAVVYVWVPTMERLRRFIYSHLFDSRTFRGEEEEKQLLVLQGKYMEVLREQFQAFDVGKRKNENSIVRTFYL